MPSSGISAFHYLISTLFDLFALVVMLRFLMQLTRADYYNPVSQFVVKATNPLLVPLRRFVPGIGGQDIAALVLCFLVLLLKFTLLKGLGSFHSSVVWGATIGMLNLVFDVFIYSIIGLVILSWVAPGHPVASLLQSITSPIMRPIQRFMPPMGGFDLSPLVALIGLQFIRILVVQPLM
jgi:YggT family protein